MRLFIDSADVEVLSSLASFGIIDGVTTNPSLFRSGGGNFEEILTKICSLFSGPVSAEVTASEKSKMLSQGRRLASLAKNICVKLPATSEGISVCRTLSDEGISVNVTLVFNSSQSLLAALAGAKFVSPFVGRIDDTGFDGMKLISEIVEIYAKHSWIKTKILAASIRNVNHVIEAARLGASVATIPPVVFEAMFKHPLTDIGLERFIKDWRATGQSTEW